MRIGLLSAQALQLWSVPGCYDLTSTSMVMSISVVMAMPMPMSMYMVMSIFMSTSIGYPYIHGYG